MSAPAIDRPRPVHRAADLLAAYLPGSFYYSSARTALLADGVHRRVQAAAGDRAEAAFDAMAAASAAGVDDPIVAGALGFRAERTSSLVVPAVVRRSGPPDAGTRQPQPAGRPEPTSFAVAAQPDPRHYVDSVRAALEMIDNGELSKVVLARSLELTAGHDVAVPRLLTRLVRANRGAHAFAADVTAAGDRAPRTLLGASPELLVARDGDTVTANPLAGSVPRGRDRAEDRRLRAQLLASTKDQREHAHVARQVAEVLGSRCAELSVPSEPDVVATPAMWHLSSWISGRLADPRDPMSSSLALAEALHPTPAVCGVPVSAARAAIGELEPADRGYYAGLVGWMGPDGDGEWVVTIRSAQVSHRCVVLHAGAGIVAGSDPEAELAETSAKFRTLLDALGMAEA